MSKKGIQNITIGSFKKFGSVLEFSLGYDKAFEIITRETEGGWRLAVFRYKSKTVRVIENHPESMESFEPLYGVTLLVVAENHDPEAFEVFLLDKPICLHKGIWHQVIALSEEAQVKITENNEVGSVFYEFKNELALAVTGGN